jgi:hypothetical protein
MICLTWWQWMLIMIVGEWCRRFGGALYEIMKAARQRRLGKYFGL